MMDAIYTYIMKTVYDRFHRVQRIDAIPNTPLAKFNDRAATSRRYRVFESGNGIYQVQIPNTGIKYVVNLKKWKCDCMDFQEYYSPCAHAIIAIRFEAEDPYQFFRACLHMKAYRATYEHFVMPINIENLESTTGIQPPQFKKLRGRPKTKRIRKGAWKRKQFHCKNCQELGHNSRTCQGAPALHGRAQRRRDRQEALEHLDELDDEIAGYELLDSADDQLETEMANYNWNSGQNRDSDSELSDLNSDRFESMDGVEIEGGSKVNSTSEVASDNKVAKSPAMLTRSGRNYGRKGIK
jgi:hypothetical protein